MSTSQWVHIGTFTNNSFSAAATSETISSSFTLPINCVLEACHVNLSQGFNGGGLVPPYSLSVGTAGTPNKYYPITNVFAPPPTPLQPVGQMGVESANTNSPLSGTNITVTASCAGGNLNAATNGLCDIWVKFSSLTN